MRDPAGEISMYRLQAETLSEIIQDPKYSKLSRFKSSKDNSILDFPFRFQPVTSGRGQKESKLNKLNDDTL